MKTKSKPVTGAFVLRSDKAEEFMKRKTNKCSDLLKRLEERKKNKRGPT